MSECWSTTPLWVLRGSISTASSKWEKRLKGCRKFVLNLCNLCFKVPEFVLSPIAHHKFISLGRGAGETLAPQIQRRGRVWCQKFVLEFVLFVLRDPRIGALFPRSVHWEQEWGSGKILAPQLSYRVGHNLLCFLCFRISEFVLLPLIMCVKEKFGANK